MRTRLLKLVRGGASVALLASGLGAVGALGIGLATSGVASAAGSPVSGTYTCTVGLPAHIKLHGSVRDEHTAPATLHIGATYDVKPEMTFAVTSTLLALAAEHTDFVLHIAGSKLGLSLTSFTGPSSVTQTGTATVTIGAPWNTTAYWHVTSTPSSALKTRTTLTDGLPPGTSVHAVFDTAAVTMTDPTGTIGTVDTGNLTTTILVPVKCHPTSYTHPVSFGNIDEIQSSGYAALALAPTARELNDATATVAYATGHTFWTASGGHGGFIWSETGTLDGLTFSGSGDHASLTGTPATDHTARTLTFTVTVETSEHADLPVTIQYTLKVKPTPATPTAFQQFKLTVLPGHLTLSCGTGPVTTQPTQTTKTVVKPGESACTLITLGSITLNEKNQIVTHKMHTLYISTARGNPTGDWTLNAVMEPTSYALTGNRYCTDVQGFCNVNTTNPVTLGSAPLETMIIPNLLGLKGWSCKATTTPSSVYNNGSHAPTTFVANGRTPETTALHEGLSTTLTLCSSWYETGEAQAGGLFIVKTGTYTLIVPSDIYAGTYYGTVEYTLMASV